MSVLWAVFYGIIQGFTEFLPISSSGHLAILQGVFGSSASGTDYFTFDVLLHMATLFSVCIIYRKDIAALIPAFFGVIAKLIKGSFKFQAFSSDEKLAVLVFIATLPLVPAVFIEDKLELLYESTMFAGAMLIINGIMLFLTDRISKGHKLLSDTKPRHAVTVGLFQALALCPGLSRSGTTITAGRICGLERSEAVRFSFILSIPTIIGANLFKIPQLVSVPVPSGDIRAYAVGMLAAALTGIAAIKLLSYVSRKSSFTAFSAYCIAVGSLTLIFCH